jgi:hypothetical protein
MKHIHILLLLLLPLVTLCSCDEMTDNDGKTRIIQDSLNTVLPTWQALKIKVENDRTEMNVVVGDATFYKASPEVKKQKAEELGKMILRIYGKDSYLKKGSLTVTADIRNQSEHPEDGIIVPIDFTALKEGK